MSQPHTLPSVAAAWDPKRGLFMVDPESPRWRGVRQAYDSLVYRTPPLVTWGEPGWLHTLRRIVGL